MHDKPIMKDHRTSTRKAAVLIASLDPATADTLLAQMSREQAVAIRRAVDQLGDLDPAEQAVVIDEFFRIGPMLPEDQPAGIDLDSQLAETIGRSSGQSNSPRRRGELKPARSSNPPLKSLHNATGAALAGRLRQEHPQTIAVVVSHLPPANGADLLASLSPQLQAEVARRLVDLEETDPELLIEIERGLKPWLNEHHRATRGRTAGMMALENILAAADPFSHESMLANLSRHDRRLAAQLSAREARAYCFADLHELDDPSLGKVLAQANQEDLTLALAGAGKAMVARAYRVLPVARGARLRRDLDRLVPVNIDDVEAAQQLIADLASELDSGGLLATTTGRKLSLAV